MDKEKRKLTIGVTVLAVVMALLSASEFKSYFNKEKDITHLVWGTVSIVSAVGLLMQRVWGYRLAQAVFIFGMIGLPFLLFMEGNFVVKLAILIVFEVIFGLVIYYLSTERVKKQFFDYSKEAPQERGSFQEKIGGVLSFLSIFSYFIFGVWGFLLNISLVSETMGLLGVIVGVTFFPVVLIAMPWYAAVALGNWLLLEVTYGGFIIAGIFCWVADRISSNKGYY